MCCYSFTRLARWVWQKETETKSLSYDISPLFEREVSIDLSHSNGYLRSCPRVGAGRYRGTRRDSRLASSRKIRVGSWNVGTLTGKFLELVDALKRKKVDIACFQETKWKGSRNREGNQYKLWYSGSTTARNGVGVVLAPNLKDKVVQVSRISDRIMMVRLVIEEETISVISAYAPQVGLGEAEKKSFWDSLDDLVRECSMTQQQLIIAGDLNGHIGAEADGFSSVHGGFGYGVRNEEGRTILEFAAAHDLVVVNSFFKKRDAHLITYHSGDHDTQIDYMLVRRGDLRVCKDCKVFPGEVCFSQHRLLALDINIKRRPRSTKMAVKPRILWKNLHGEAAEAFRTRVTEGVTPELGGRTTTDAEQMWNRLANTIREAAKETLGVVAGASRTHIGRRESWWFSEEVQNKVKAKQTRFRELISMQGNEADRSATEERYKEAKREAKKAVARAKDKAYEDLYKRLDSKEGENDIYRIAKARQRRKMDLGSVRFIKDEDGRSIVNEDAIRRRWKEYFSALFNGQRRGRTEDVDSIGAIPQNNCYCSRIRHAEVKEALRKMGRNKAVGPDEIPIEAWRCLGGEGVRWLTILFNKTLSRAKMPEEWRLSEVMYEGAEDLRVDANRKSSEYFPVDVGLHQGLFQNTPVGLNGRILEQSSRREITSLLELKEKFYRVVIRDSSSMLYGQSVGVNEGQANRMEVANNEDVKRDHNQYLLEGWRTIVVDGVKSGVDQSSGGRTDKDDLKGAAAVEDIDLMELVENRSSLPYSSLFSFPAIGFCRLPLGFFSFHVPFFPLRMGL
ncbi:ubiquinol oxidase, mitochondrial-like protein [Tanacetum coccineum]